MVHIPVTGMSSNMKLFRISYPCYLDMGYHKINLNSISQIPAQVRITCIRVTKLYKYAIPNPYVTPNPNTKHKSNAILENISACINIDLVKKEGRQVGKIFFH